MNIDKSTSPIFIGGLMKSGTSLLRVLLGQHKDLYASFETHWFEETVRNHWHDPASTRMKYIVEFFELENAYSELCNYKANQPDREFIDILMQYCTQRARKKRWVEKTPANIRHWTLIREIWPDAYLIHVTREYRDCFASWKVRRGNDLDTFINAVDIAYEDIDGMLGSNTDNYMEVDYIDLVSDTENAIKKILDFVDAIWDDNCVRINTVNTSEEREKVKQVVGKDSKTSISLSKPIFTDSIGQWKTLLTTVEAEYIKSKLSKRYTQLGSHW